MARKFTKYPSNYVKATAYYVSEAQMGDWKQIARAYAKKVGAELLFVNENSFGIEYPDGTMQHIRVEDLQELLRRRDDIEACSNIKASTIGDNFEIGDIVEIHTSMDGWFGEYEVIREAKPEDYVRLSQNYMQDYSGIKYLLQAIEPGFIDETIETSRNMRKI